MADAVIGIRIDPTGAVTGARTVRRSMDDITGSSRAATSAVNMLRAAMMSLGAAISVRQLADMADTWSTIQWRVRNATSSLQEAERTMRRISEVARRTWSSLDQTAEAFLRQEAAMSALGYTTRQQLDHIEALNSALLISGLRGQRAEQVAAAWARAMARGTLRGDEFNSVAENSSRLMQALADHLGVSVVELRALAEQGKLTSAAMYGITDSLTDLRAEMEGDATLKGALVVLRNEMTRVVGEMDSAARASSSLGNMIVALADNMDVVAAIAGGVAVSAVLALTAAINTATIATRAWSAALAITPLGMIALAIGTVTTALIYYRNQTVEVGDVSIRVGNVLHAIWTTVSQPVAALVNWVGSLLLALGQLATFDFSGSWETFRQSGQAWVDAGNNIIDAWRNLTAEGEQAETVSDAVAEALGNAGSVAGDAAKKFGDVVAALSQQNERAMLMARAMGEGGAAVNRLNLEFEVYDNLLRAGVIPKTASLREALSLSTSMANDNARAIGDLTHTYWHYQQQIESLQRIQDLDDQLELAQAELRLVEETADVRAEALAVLEAEIRLKRMGVDLSSRLAQEELKRVRSLARTREAISQNTSQMEEQRRLGKQVADDTIRYTSDLFADLFRETSDGWRGMWQNMRDTMISMLARMAAEAALRPIVVSVLGAMGVAGAGAAAGAAGVGGGGGILGSLFGMGQQAASLGGAGGLFAEGGALAGVGSFMNQPLFMVPTGAIEAGTGAMAMAPGISLGGVLGAAGLGYMGGGLIAQLTGGNQMGGSLGGAGGAALGAAIGSAIPGIGTVIGGIAGGLLGGGIGSLFGGGGNTDQQIRPYSHARGTGRGVQTPFREFRNSAHRFDGSALEQAVVQADKAIAAALSDRAIEQVRDYFDLAGTIKGTKRDNKKLSEKHFARFIRDSFTDMMEALGGTAAREGFSRMASGLGNDPEAVLELAQQAAILLGNLADNRLFKPQEVSQLEQAWKALEQQGEEFKSLAAQLGQPIEEVMRQLREAQAEFQAEIQQGYQDQIDQFLRPAELAWRQLREAQAKEIKELEKIGASTARAQQLHQLQIRALFEQNYELQRQYLEGMIDLGEDLNAQLGALWGIVGTGIGGLIADSNAAYQEAVRLGRQYAQINRSLQQTIAGLRTGPQSPLSLEQQLMEALDRFRQTLGEALGGDSEAAQQLQQLVNPVLDLASQFFGRTEGYAQIFDEVLRGLEMAGVAMETQAGGFAALASALDAQIDILNEINDVLNRRDELGEDFESRYNKLTSELEEVGYTIGGINAFLRDAADAIPTTIVTAFASGLDSAQLAKRMGELFQATVTATEQAMRDGVENIGAAIDGAQQALLRGWIPDFIELAEQFNGAIPEIRFDRVTARVVAHYEASADQLGVGLERAVAQVQFDGLQQSIYVAQQLVGTRFDTAVGGISFEGIDGEYLSAVLYDGITGIAQAAQVTLIGQAERIEGVINSTLEAFTLDTARATITESVDIINRGATQVQLAFGRVEGALLRLTNSADGHIIALIDEVDTTIARFTNWGTGSLRVGIESLRAQLLDVRNAGEGALLLFAGTVEARRVTIENLNAGTLVARINNLRSALLTIRNTGQGRLAFWADEVDAQKVRIEDLGAHPLLVQINNLRAGLVDVRAAGQARLASWRDAVEGHRAEINGIGIGDINANGNELRTRLTNVRNVSQNKLAGWRNAVQARLDQIRDIDAGDIPTNANQLRGALASTRNTAQNRLSNWAKAVQNGLDRIANLSNDLGGGAIAAELQKIVENRLPKRFADAIDRAFESVFGASDNINFLAGMSSLVGANSALVTSLRSLAQTMRMGAENAEQIRRAQVDTYAAGVRGSVSDALGAGVAAGSRTETGYTSTPIYRDGVLYGYNMIKTSKQVRDDSNRKAPLEAALAEIAGHFQSMLGLANLPKRTLKVDDGSPYFEQLTISGYGSIQTSKVNDMRRLASFMMESYVDWALKGNRLPAEVQKILDGRNWSPGNVENALANLAKSLGYAGHLPSFASGGLHAGGWRLVGEHGPELEYTGPSRIYSAPDTSRIMAAFANDNGSFRELITEVRALRAENAELRRTVSEGFGDTVQAEGQSGLALRAELRGLREDVEDLQATMRQQERRRAS